MTRAFVRDELFKPFVSTKDSGFGLGAFEALQIAQTMGGAIEVASEPGKGSNFTLWLPLADARAAAGGEARVTKVGLTRTRAGSDWAPCWWRSEECRGGKGGVKKG